MINKPVHVFLVTAVIDIGAERPKSNMHPIVVEQDYIEDMMAARAIARRVSELPGVDHVEVTGDDGTACYRDGENLGRGPIVLRRADKGPRP